VPSTRSTGSITYENAECRIRELAVGIVRTVPDYATGMNALQDRMIDAWGRHPLCTHKAAGVDLAQFVVSTSGAKWSDVEILECPDVHLLARLLMRSNYVARADRKLFGVVRR
jgi:hypothetical protein